MISFQKIIRQSKGMVCRTSRIKKIDRCLRRSSTQVVTDQSFHVVSNVSEDAYAAVMYERNVYEDGSVSMSFIASKSKVSPLIAHSTSRLELVGAILEMYLCQVVSNVLGDHVMKKSVFWCDSMNVLFWMKNPSRKFKSFVANRIGKIHTVTESTQWNFGNGKINPADIGS